MDYKTPGVYIKEVSIFPPSVAQVATAIPAFIGYTEAADKKPGSDDDGLLRVPYRISSMLEYVEHFGGPPVQDVVLNVSAEGIPTSAVIPLDATTDLPQYSIFKMYHSMQMFFANGGGACWIVSVGDYNAASINADALNDTVSATAPGGLTLIKKIDEATLLLFPDADGLTNPTVFYDLYEAALQQCADLQDRFTIIDVMNYHEDIVDDPPAGLRQQLVSSNLKYGAAYYPYLRTILSYHTTDASVSINQNGAGGTPPTMDALPAELDTDAFKNTAKRVIGSLSVVLPPSSSIAGIYAAVDSSRGVWKAPANVSVSSIVAPVEKINDEEQGLLNVDPTGGKSINAIRTFAGKGSLVWGARTLAGNDNEWRYVSVRRFFNMVEESVKKASAAFVFEPNDANTWVKVRAMIENFLLLQWRAGALAGAVPEHAFFVRVGLPETMTSLDILEGRMNVEIGMAVVRPAEFIILKFSHLMQVS